MVISLYENQPYEKWIQITRNIIEKHPLDTSELVDCTLSAWESIFLSGIGKEQFKIGKDLFPSPQIMGFLLHELIALKLKSKHPKEWSKESKVDEKDLVYIPLPEYSIEIKTSSNKNKIFGNRSYGQETLNQKKGKEGYYLAINFEKFSESPAPKIKLIRFGWLDHTDWISQKAATGQQSRLKPEADKYKLIEIYPTNRLN